jgi:hypothetical protein
MKSKPIICMMVIFAFLVSLTFTGAAQILSSDVLSQLNAYNVNWNSASTTGSMASMPLGNGDITANVWVESNGKIIRNIDVLPLSRAIDVVLPKLK